MNLLSALLATVLINAPLLAYSHGEKSHSSPIKSTKEDFEQQPWGIGADKNLATRTISVTLDDNMKFSPGSMEFNHGEVVNFIVTNKGKLMHEFVLGTKLYNQEHAELMKRFPNMEHAEPHMAHVAPGETVELTWKFNQAGQFEFACLIAGHYDAGMHGPVTVTPKPD